MSHEEIDQRKRESGFKKLKIWQLGMDIAKRSYEITRHFPEHERFGLISQMRRSAISIPSNIAEGYARKNDKEFRQFLYIALGSLAELETQMLLSLELNYMNLDQEDVLDLVAHERSMILKVCHQKRRFI